MFGCGDGCAQQQKARLREFGGLLDAECEFKMCLERLTLTKIDAVIP